MEQQSPRHWQPSSSLVECPRPQVAQQPWPDAPKIATCWRMAQAPVQCFL
jgi:hypothetical protein